MPQRLLFCVLLVGFGGTSSIAQPFRFTRIVDSSSFALLWEGAFDGSKVAFQGGESYWGGGVYLYDLTRGSLEVVYDASTTVPGLTGGIRSVDQLQIDNDVVVFRGWTDHGALAFAYENGRLRIAAGPQFGSTANVSLENGELAFTTDRAYVGPLGGPYILVASNGDPAIGGAGSVGQIFGVRADHQDVYLWAWSGEGDGIFRCHPSGTWELMYHGSDFGTMNPPYQEFFLVQLDAADGRIGFYVAETGTDVPALAYVGLHTARGRVLEETIATGMPVPGGAGQFDGTGGPYSLDGGHVVALGTSGNYHGIFTTLSGSLQEVLGTDDRLEGKPVRYVSLGADALEGNGMVFVVGFEDGSRGLYLAEWLGAPGRVAQRPRAPQRPRCGETSRRGRPRR